MSVSFTKVQQIQVCYEVVGDGPDVVFVHGWTSSRRMWTSLTARLAGRFRCWALDLPGCGDSGQPAAGWYAIANYTRLVADFMRAVGAPRAAVVGHSMGGMIALDLAAAQPEQVARLVAINPVVTGRRASLRPLAHWGPGWHLLDWWLRLSPRVLLPVLGGPGNRAVPPFLRRAEDFVKGSADSILRSGRAVTTYDVSPRLAHISAPTLVLVGKYDLTVSSREGRLAAAAIPGARLEDWPTGHQLADERPAELARVLEGFLAC